MVISFHFNKTGTQECSVSREWCDVSLTSLFFQRMLTYESQISLLLFIQQSCFSRKSYKSMHSTLLCVLLPKLFAVKHGLVFGPPCSLYAQNL